MPIKNTTRSDTWRVIKVIVAAMASIVLSVILAGCDNPQGPPTKGSIVVKNDFAWDLEDLYINLDTASNGGPNLAGDGFKSNSSITKTGLAPGKYTVVVATYVYYDYYYGQFWYNLYGVSGIEVTAGESVTISTASDLTSSETVWLSSASGSGVPAKKPIPAR